RWRQSLANRQTRNISIGTPRVKLHHNSRKSPSRLLDLQGSRASTGVDRRYRNACIASERFKTKCAKGRAQKNTAPPIVSTVYRMFDLEPTAGGLGLRRVDCLQQPRLRLDADKPVDHFAVLEQHE